MTDPSELAVLHARLVEKSPDYKVMTTLNDARLEAVLAALEKDGVTHENYKSLTGELRGLRAARGASTVKRGQK